MGFFAFAQLDEVYHRVKANALRNGVPGASTVLIFVSPDADALCALRILVNLLKSDCIAHKVVPVAGYTDLSEANEDHVEANEELRSIIMLNCGGLVDLTEMFSLSEEMTVYVCDSHRPLSLQGLFGHDQIMFLDDGDVDQMSDLREAVEELEFAETDSEADENAEEEGSDSEASASEGENEDPTEEDEVGEVDEKDDEHRKPGKRKKPPADEAMEIISPPTKKVRASERRRRRKQQQRLIAEYYAEGAYYGMSVAGIIYTMASQLGRASNDFVWLSIIGLSDQYLHDRIDQRRYLSQVETYKDEVARFNIRHGGGDENDDIDSLFGESATKSGPGSAIIRNADDHAIRCDDEFRLMLLRHWTLYESMYHSSYVATKLGIWKERGRQRLTNLLVKMGLPHKESQQRFTEMNITFKRSIRDKLSSVAPRYNMSEIIFPSFCKSFGYKGVVSAPDTVYALTALLDWGAEWITRHSAIAYSEGMRPVSSRLGRPGGGRDETSELGTGGLAGVGVGTRTGMAAVAMRTGDSIHDDGNKSDEDDEDLAEEEQERRKKEKQRAWVRNFYVAYDALDSFDILQQGIQLSMNFQRILVRTGVSVLEKKLTQTLRTFQLAVLTGEGLGSAIDGSGALTDENDFSLFGRSPAHLGRLAKFLMDAFREYRQKDLPLVIAAFNTVADAYLVIGFTGSTKGGVVRKNTFGPAFQRAAQRTNARIRHDSFETSVMEVRKEDLTDFLESLQLFMQ
ncbi:DNA replication initiation factor CDC45 [Spizellomyces punctatus DAOM BR117]|uniref:CDC45-like protein n=1 Tax=Spizellomyces punctatus (strain DAOM BR117) TaxID=645134 RepID=A0A0L0HPW4_SPIPD|nr:DNA replication initiation factor CDC45 [Spizellomyces punctatus DAOM BR117]KND03063.1 hypothetical protein SPPG_02128 [Spizellomyces punctatus DAOM BR117]|eukprot:XP_016611102.1 hypothetical protein SPPG_02128 [Spizellomyces punctatus DAOM BR117]